MPAIDKIKGVTEYEFQQSKYYPECPRVPMRTCLVSGSGGGKTTTILVQPQVGSMRHPILESIATFRHGCIRASVASSLRSTPKS